MMMNGFNKHDLAFESELERLLRETAIDQISQPADLRAFHSANGFHEGAIRCAEHKTNVDQPDTFRAAYPAAVVNFAFACELYLKAILISEGRVARGHELDRLSNVLSPEWSKRLGEQYGLITGLSSADLKRDIAKLANCFIDWRYIYEADERSVVALADLTALTKALYISIRTGRPEWSVPPDFDEVLRKGGENTAFRVYSFANGANVVLTRKNSSGGI